MPNAATPGPEILPLGQDGVLVRFARRPSPAAAGAVQAFAADLETALPEGVREVVPSLASVLLRFDPARVGRVALADEVARRLNARDWLAAPRPAPHRRWTVPAAFGGSAGPQLADFAALAGLSEAQLVADVAETDLRVLAIGFAPGLPYLGLLPPAREVPRQPELTPKVPAGTIAAAVRQLVLFPTDSATGWRSIGRTAFRPFVMDRAEPFLLRPGDALRFAPVGESELAALEDPGGLGGARCEVLG